MNKGRELSEAKRKRLEKLERMCLWGCTFNSLFSAARRPDAPRAVDQPLSFGEICGALHEIVNAQEDTFPREDLLRVCLAQMLVAGYQPTRQREALDRLIQMATTSSSSETDGQTKLMEFGYVQYGKGSQSLSPPPPPEYLAEQPFSEVAFPRPTEISYDGRVFTVTKRMLLRCPTTPLAPFIDPQKWIALGPFFELTQREEHRKQGKTGGWNGVLHEVFKIDWNGWTTEHFDVRLRIDHTVSDDVIRADYSLMYEKHDQLHCDDGIAEIRKIPGYTDWCWYTGMKSLKFSSDFLNLLAPGVLFMGLEREALGIAGLARMFTTRSDGARLLHNVLSSCAPTSANTDVHS